MFHPTGNMLPSMALLLFQAIAAAGVVAAKHVECGGNASALGSRE